MAKGSRPGGGGGGGNSPSGNRRFKTRGDYDKAIGELNQEYDRRMNVYKKYKGQADSVKGRSAAAKAERAKFEKAANREYARAMLVYQTRAGLQAERTTVRK